ncbi:hypothetical protein SY88_21435 [Clostridiales bacterium PH28_bin88]|nr:hypothetical protein SY88_21435 [Clostridiales bacterium PH28_bin88]
MSGPDQEQPYALGALKLRLPFIHYGIEFPDLIQGAILCVVPMGVTAIFTSSLGIPFELGITMVILNNFLYLLHTSFGDPAVAGWITPGIPLYVAFLAGFPQGPERIQAMIALQMVVGLIFLLMGVLRLAGTAVNRVPTSLKGGILLGAGIASVISEFGAKGRVSQMPVTILFGAAVSFFMLFSKTTQPLRKKYSFFRYVAQYGIAVPFVISYALGIIIKEVKIPEISWGMTNFQFGEVVRQFSVFGVGFPPFQFFLAAVPMAIAAYIIAFGDVLVLSSLLKTADEARSDEKVLFNPNRNSVIVSIRNLFESFFMPYLPLAGPQWTGGQALVVNRYINSTREQEDSYWGGATSIFWGMSIALLLGPVVSLFKPGVAVGMSLTLLIQGYLCAYLAMEMLETNLQRGIAGIVGAVLATKGAAWGLAVGLVLYFVLEHQWIKPEVSSTQKVSA